MFVKRYLFINEFLQIYALSDYNRYPDIINHTKDVLDISIVCTMSKNCFISVFNKEYTLNLVSV